MVPGGAEDGLKIRSELGALSFVLCVAPRVQRDRGYRTKRKMRRTKFPGVALLQKYESHFDRVSTGSGSDLAQPPESKILHVY